MLLSACNSHFYHVSGVSTLTVRDAKDSLIMRQTVAGKFAVNTKYLSAGSYTVLVGIDTTKIIKH